MLCKVQLHRSPGTLKATFLRDWKSTGKCIAREPHQVVASISQMWQKDAEMDKTTRRFVTSGNSDMDNNGTIWSLNPHISTAYENILKKFTYMCDRDTVVNRERKCKISTQIRLYGECPRPLLFKLQFIWGKIIQIIYIPPRINPSEH